MPSDQYWTLHEDELILLEPVAYEKESDLQELVARYPELLARSLDDHDDARWISIKREATIRLSAEDESARWSLDNLYVDSTGMPVLVEVKRASDPRIRREVVAQLLDYAASFTSTWNAEKLKIAWQETVVASQLDPDVVMSQFLADTEFSIEDEFWRSVERHVKAGEMRLLIVADQIPSSLARIIEYLNEQMADTELLGLEIRPRRSEAGTGPRSYSVNVVGNTAASTSAKPTSEPQTEAHFDAVLRANRGEAELAAVRRLLDALLLPEGHRAAISMGTSETNPLLFVDYQIDGGDTFWPIRIRPRQGRVVLQLRWLAFRPGFTEESEQLEFRDRIGAAAGVQIEGSLNGFPWFPSALLLDDETLEAVVAEIQWAVDRVRTASAQ